MQIGHTLPEDLPRTATCIDTLLRFQTCCRPLVLARRTANLDEFPLEGSVFEAEPDSTRASRIRSRARAFAHGYRETYQHRIAVEARRGGCVALHAHFGWAGRGTVDVARRLAVRSSRPSTVAIWRTANGGGSAVPSTSVSSPRGRSSSAKGPRWRITSPIWAVPPRRSGSCASASTWTCFRSIRRRDGRWS